VIEETVTVEELYQEELDALVEQHKILLEEGGEDNQRIADSLLHVIAYFRARIGAEDDFDVAEIYGIIPSDQTIH
jgi:hypothetical protein